jgi:hypothetical protein
MDMKILLILSIVTFGVTSAFAVADPEPNSMGIYFDRSADTNCLTSPAGTPFFTYLILTNPTPDAINAYELGLEIVVPAGMEGQFFQLSSNIADNLVSGIQVGINGPLGGDYIVGLAGPLPSQPAVILHSWQHILLALFPVEIFIGASSLPSIPGSAPVFQDADRTLLMQAIAPTGDFSYPAATVNSDCVVGVENMSFGGLKSLFR